MAVTKTHPIKSTLKAAIDYICNPEKTDGKLLVSSYGCAAETADIEFAWTRRHAIDKGTNLGRHLIQAFQPGEVTPEQAHEIGMKLAKEILGGKYEFVLTTHIDKDHVHNHLIFNAVSFADYKHYHSNKRSYHYIRRTSDRLCKEHGLSVIIPGQDKGKSYIEHQAAQNGTSYKAKLRAAIDRLLRENRAKIESLQRSAAQLRKANLRIDGLEKMIADMNRQLAEKKAEVEQLRESLVRMGDEVKSLTEEVAVRSAEVENLSGEKVELQNQLNTVYYIVGAEKELRDAQIINKQGFIGRTLTVGRNSNFDSFTMADSRLLSEVPVGQKKATLVTSHPEGSYELVTDANKVVEKLIITDPVRFWESSKILIISYK